MELTEPSLRAALIELRQGMTLPPSGASCLHWAHAARAHVERVFHQPCAVIGGLFVMRYSSTDPDGVLAYGREAGVVLTALGARGDFDGHAWAQVGDWLLDAGYADRHRSALRLYRADGRGNPDPWPFPELPLVMPARYVGRSALLSISQRRLVRYAYCPDDARTFEAQRRGELPGIRAFVSQITSPEEERP